MNTKLINKKSLISKLNNLFELSNEYFFFFFSWSFFYWNAGNLSYKKIYGNFQT